MYYNLFESPRSSAKWKKTDTEELVHRVPFTRHSRKGKSIETENRLVFAGWGEKSITKGSQETLWGEKLFFIMIMATQPNTSIRTHQSLHSKLVILTYMPKLTHTDKSIAGGIWSFFLCFFFTFKRAWKINFRLSTVIISKGFLFVCSFVLEFYFGGVCFFWLHVLVFFQFLE